MLPGRIEAVTLAEVQRLRDNKVPEGRAIEYKKELPGNSDSARKEFLADVSSRANASGGNLLFGIEAKGGIPVALNPIRTDEPEAVIARMESSAADGIDPRISGISTKYLPCDEGYIFVVYVPQSWNGPHMVTFKGSSKFFSRNSIGKFPLDVRQIGEAFVSREELPQRIRAFRDLRVHAIADDGSGLNLLRGGKVILHLVPFGFDQRDALIDIEKAAKANVAPMGADSFSGRHNFDGYLTLNQNNGGETRRYLQVFRNGVIESVDASTLQLAPPNPQGGRLLPISGLENRIISYLNRYLDLLRLLEVTFPVSVMLTLTGVLGWGLQPGQYSFDVAPNSIDRDVLKLPELIVDTAEINIGKELRPVFDVIWNSAGWPHSLSYDESGERKPD